MAKAQTLKEKYEKEVAPVISKEFSIENKMAVPKLSKIVINIGMGDLLKNKDAQDKLAGDLATITGQKPKVQAARKSVAGFAIREGNPVGLTVTLRGKRMWSFLDKLISVSLPRLRDFRGIPTKSFDGQGNYTLGLSEYTIFPEIDLAKVDRNHGLEITIVTSAGDKEISKRFLELLGMPFSKEG